MTGSCLLIDQKSVEGAAPCSEGTPGCVQPLHWPNAQPDHIGRISEALRIWDGPPFLAPRPRRDIASDAWQMTLMIVEEELIKADTPHEPFAGEGLLEAIEIVRELRRG